MTIKANASMRIKFSNPKQLTAAVVALKPEVNSPATHRANVDLRMQDCFLTLTIDAEDTVALRATINTYLRWITSTVNVIEAIERM